MKNFLRRFPGLAVAVVAVIFSATIVLASQPGGNGPSGLANAGTHANLSADGSAEPDESAEPEESADANTPEGSGSPCNVDLTQDPSVLATLNHGSVVCTAAHMPTPSGYANHGAWVSHWARMNHGPSHGQSPTRGR